MIKNYHGPNFRETKTCFHCKNGNYCPGVYPTFDDPGEPESIKCTIPSVMDDEQLYYDWLDAHRHLEYFDLADECSGFDPIIIEECANCRKTINSEQWQHKLWVASIWDTVPVCSEKCKSELEKKIQDDLDKHCCGI